MVFSSAVFLFAFLPLALALYYVVPARWRAAPLLLTSAVFYAWGEPVLVVLILLTGLFTYSWGRLLAETERPGARRALLVVGIVVDLVPIAVFKYLDFVLVTVGLGRTAENHHLPLPIGVSFYTFMAVGYLVDIYRRPDAGAPRLLAFSGFLTMFPHLVAGPIVRWYDIGPQLEKPRFDPGLFGYGALRVSSGLVKKSVLADSLAVEVDRLFATGAPTSTGAAWVGAVLYSLQIYLDFSAYSDIAIGLAAMLGIRFPENFRFPYVARSAREFWQRWHISLGSWFRDYLYVPLGGSRVGRLLLWRNLLVVWGVTGLWHGAAWTFVVWGLYFGVVIGLERSWYGDALARLPRVVQHAYGLLVAVVGWVIFRSSSLHQVGEYYRAMAGLGGRAWDASATYSLEQTWVIVLLGVVLSAGAARPLMDRIERNMAGRAAGEGEAAPLDTAMASAPTVIALPRPRPRSPGPSSEGQGGVAQLERVGITTEQLTVVVASEAAAPEPEPRRRLGAGLAVGVTVLVAAFLAITTAFVVSVSYSPFIYFRF
ncbi:MAG: MBOAT family O-acyltransferase [Actinomycetales bacterium]